MEFTQEEKDYLTHILLVFSKNAEDQLNTANLRADLKQNELEALGENYHKLLKEHEQKIKSPDVNGLYFYDSTKHRPVHGQLYLCIRKREPGVAHTDDDFMCLKYNDRTKYWDYPCSDVDGDKPEGCIEYCNNPMYVMPLSFDNIKVIF